ncbi:Rib/alpha-like domain-containing protein, partial [Limosilactobacillus reuteri]|uniref:Rib/alpha-like domain-containing protein n=1 Tax=Limosilactobacillus reuteri TaxID=1598 RepID=UPI0022702423
KNAPAKLAAAKQAASQAAQVLADAKAELQKQQDALAPFTEAIKAAQAKVATAQKTVDQANQAVKEAQSNLDQANNKLADAKMTDAQRYGKEVVVNPVSLTAGDQVPSPKLANALTLNDNNGFAVVINNGTAAELPAGTTAQWANEVQVQADANNAGSYTEDVLVTFPDGSQTTVKAGMNIAAKKANVHTNGSKLTSTTSDAVNSFGNNIKSVSASDANSNNMTSEAYKASQKNQLPQTAKDQLTTDQKTQANAQKAVDNFNADQATKQDAANKAQQTLDQANNQLAVAKTALDQATQKLANLQKVAANKA